MFYLYSKKELQLLVSNTNKLTLLGSYIVPWAIKYRNELVLRRFNHETHHLDIGCGNGYLVWRSPAHYVVGIDKKGGFMINRSVSSEMKILPGVDIEKSLEFQDHSFDIVTSVAVIEHLNNCNHLFSEVYRVLKPGGKFIITTPAKIVDYIISLLDRGSSQLGGHGVHQEHKHSFKIEDIKTASTGKFEIAEYKRFQLGLNKLFVLRKVCIS